MIKRFGVLALAALGTGAFAQSFNDGFENAVYSGGINATGNLPGDTVTSVVTWLAANRSATAAGAPSIGPSAWFDGNSTVFSAHAGIKYIAANYQNTLNADNIDNWLFSPVETFHNGDTISFFTRTTNGTFPDRLILKLSGNGSSIASADFSTTLVTVNPGLLTGTAYPNVWTQFSTTLSGLGSGVSGRFAFNYNVTNGGPSGANSDYIGIDDVAYTAAPVPEPASMAILGMGALALLRKRRKT